MQKQGGSRTYMYFNKLVNLVLDLPSLEEQHKIMEFIQTIDKKIELVKQQIEYTQTFKKGLLQQMFV
jgi:type I restriction enzyme S subunit